MAENGWFVRWEQLPTENWDESSNSHRGKEPPSTQLAGVAYRSRSADSERVIHFRKGKRFERCRREADEEKEEEEETKGQALIGQTGAGAGMDKTVEKCAAFCCDAHSSGCGLLRFCFMVRVIALVSILRSKQLPSSQCLRGQTVTMNSRPVDCVYRPPQTKT